MFVIELSVHPERHLVQRLKALAIGADRQLVENGLQFANAVPTTNTADMLPNTGSKAGDAIQSDAEISSAPLFSWALIRPCFSGGRT
jgi:hypothetical protein